MIELYMHVDTHKFSYCSYSITFSQLQLLLFSPCNCITKHFTRMFGLEGSNTPETSAGTVLLADTTSLYWDSKTTPPQ